MPREVTLSHEMTLHHSGENVKMHNFIKSCVGAGNGDDSIGGEFPKQLNADGLE
jgi:hypothetical protein